MKFRNSILVVLFVLFQFIFHPANAQQSFQSTYYEQRRTLFENLPNARKEIIFLGNSITDGGEWVELFNNKRIKNRGISGDTTEGVLFRLSEVTESKPSKVFLLIGINDLARNISEDTVFENICRIVTTIRDQSPKTRIYIQSILPVNPAFGMFAGHCSKTREVMSINEKLMDFCSRTGVQFVDVFSRLKNENDNLMNPVFTNDGLHLTGRGYMEWAGVIRPLL